MRKLACLSITLYQKILSPDTGIPKKIGLVRGTVCKFYPTCSEYTKQAIQKYGILKGTLLGFRRIGRCHPWQHPTYDPLA